MTADERARYFGGASTSSSWLSAAFDHEIAVAEWVFVSPLYGKRAHEYLLKGLGHVRGAKDKIQTLTHEEMEKVVKYVNEISRSDMHAFILEQHHGAFIFVAAGWWHAVRNIQNCVKYAVEFFEARPDSSVCTDGEGSAANFWS